MKSPKEEPKHLGRPPGKRSDPAFQPVTAWVRKSTYQAVRERLFKEGRKEFSVLVEELLQGWLKTPRRAPRAAADRCI
jgi:hypothetical protein